MQQKHVSASRHDAPRAWSILGAACRRRQLYFGEVPEDSRKLLFVRWKPPEEIAAIGEAATVRDAVAQHFEAFFRQFFPNLAVKMMHTLEDPANAPRPNWG